MPVSALGITRIATTHESGALRNRAGIVLRGGRAVPTFDWIAEPVWAPAL